MVTDIVHSGKYAGRFTIHEDNVFNARQLRVQANGPKVTVREGSDTFVSFYMYMKDPPKDRDNFFYWEGSPPPRYNNVMTWWVEPKKDGSGTVIKYGTGNLGRKGVHWEGDFTVDRWHQLGMHIHWSEDPAKGNVRLWWDGELVLDKKVQTKGPQSVYFSQPGIHRDPHTKSVNTIYFDDILCATTLEEIEIRRAGRDEAEMTAQTEMSGPESDGRRRREPARETRIGFSHLLPQQDRGSLLHKQDNRSGEDEVTMTRIPEARPTPVAACLQPVAIAASWLTLVTLVTAVFFAPRGRGPAHPG